MKVEVVAEEKEEAEMEEKEGMAAREKKEAQAEIVVAKAEEAVGLGKGGTRHTSHL